jgi:hypothetical protein
MAVFKTWPLLLYISIPLSGGLNRLIPSTPYFSDNRWKQSDSQASLKLVSGGITLKKLAAEKSNFTSAPYLVLPNDKGNMLTKA